jgi:DNA-binding MarR family transcriptional regulator
MKYRPQFLEILQDMVVRMVRQDDRDLTARQLAVLLMSCLDDPPHTVHGLAILLEVPRPSISRAIDRLEQLHLVERTEHQGDRRNVLAVGTASGRALVRELGTMMLEAAGTAHRPSAGFGSHRSRWPVDAPTTKG